MLVPGKLYVISDKKRFRYHQWWPKVGSFKLIFDMNKPVLLLSIKEDQKRSCENYKQLVYKFLIENKIIWFCASECIGQNIYHESRTKERFETSIIEVN